MKNVNTIEKFEQDALEFSKNIKDTGILALNKNEHITGFFEKFEKAAAKGKSDRVYLRDKNDEIVILWSWGLLSYKINQANIKIGELIQIHKTEKTLNGKPVNDKSKKGFWGAKLIRLSDLTKRNELVKKE